MWHLKLLELSLPKAGDDILIGAAEHQGCWNVGSSWRLWPKPQALGEVGFVLLLE